MANTYKNIVITPNRDTDAANVPSIRFSGGDTTSNTDINVRVYTTQSGTLSFEGSAGQLFSITNDLTNTIFSVNDVSGIPSLEIDANGLIKLAEFGGNVAIGRANASYKLDVTGTTNISDSLIVAGINVVPAIASSFDKANAANLLAFNIGAGANAYLLATIAGANTAVGTAANNFSVATFGAANNTPVGNTFGGTFTTRSTRRSLNFLPGTNITINVDDDSIGNRSNITVSSTAGGGDVSTTTLNGANIAVGAGANTVGIAAFAKANAALANSTGTYSGDLTITGTVSLLAAGGDEGGEIHLANSITNSVMNGHVVIDIYQNKLRFFESGSPNRGAFINLANATSSVGTDLLANVGSGGSSPGPAFDKANSANIIASQSFDKANSANLLAFNTGIGANAFSAATIAGANTAVGTGANAYATAATAGANAYMIAVQAGSNTAVGTGANTYLLATIAGANTAVGTGANTYLLATIAGANTAVGTGANAFATAAAAGANAYMIAVQAGSNTAVGAGANTYLLATIAGANTAVGAGANTVGSAAFAKANSANLLAFAALPNVTNVSFAGNLFFPTGNVSIGNTVIDSDARLTIDGNVRMFSSKSLQLILEADTDNTDEQDYPRIVLKQDGNTRVTHIGYVGNTSNDFEIKTLDFNSLRLGTSGSARLTIDGTGNVGIGTTSPDAALEVWGGSYSALSAYSNGGGIIIDQNGSSINYYQVNTHIFTSGSPDYTERMRIVTSGNVAIGRVDANYKLDVVGTINAAGILINGSPLSGGDVTTATLNGANTAVGGGANAFATAATAGANAYMIAVQAGSNTAVGTGANTFLLATIAGANTAVGAGANAFATAATAGANAYMIAVQAGSNTAVGTGANTYLLATIAGANTAVGTGANTYLLATIAGANTAVGGGANAFATAAAAGANAFATAATAGANAYMIAVQAGSNTAVGTGANTFLLATIAGANTAVGTGANTYLLATIAGANTAVGTGANAFATAATAGANAYMIAVQAGSNTAVGAGANAFAVATFNAANTRPVGNTLASAFTSRSTRRTLNFIPGTNIAINVDDDSAGDRSNVTISSTALGGGDVTTATLNGANTAVGAGANTVSIAAFAKANAALANTDGITTAGSLNVSGNLTTTGIVLIGTTSARSNFLNASLASAGFQIEGIAATNSSMSIIRDSSNANPPRMFLAKSRGVTVGSNALVQSGDILGSISFEGNDGAEFVEGAKIDSVVDGTAAADTMPSRLEFHTSNTSSPIERMRIDSSGNVSIGTILNPEKLTANGGIAALGQLSGGKFAANGAYLGLEGAYGCLELVGDSGAVIDFSRINEDFRGRIVYDNPSNTMIFYTAAGEKLRVDASGNVLINRSTSTVGLNTKLDVAGAVNASAYLVNGVDSLVKNNTTTLISTGYTVGSFNAGANIAEYGTWTPNPANGNYQYATCNGAVTIATPPANCAIDVLFTNAPTFRNPGAVTMSGYTAGAANGSAYALTAGARYILSIREINSIATFSWYALQ